MIFSNIGVIQRLDYVAARAIAPYSLRSEYQNGFLNRYRCFSANRFKIEHNRLDLIHFLAEQP